MYHPAVNDIPPFSWICHSTSVYITLQYRINIQPSCWFRITIFVLGDKYTSWDNLAQHTTLKEVYVLFTSSLDVHAPFSFYNKDLYIGISDKLVVLMDLWYCSCFFSIISYHGTKNVLCIPIRIMDFFHHFTGICVQSLKSFLKTFIWPT